MHRSFILLFGGALMLTACAGGTSSAGTSNERAIGQATSSPTPVPITVTSPAFSNGGTIPKAYTCDGAGTSPPLELPSTLPAGAVSLAVAMEDLDAPGGAFQHWAAWNLPPDSVPADADTTVADIVLGLNSAGRIGYTPPCPPTGQTRSYIFTVYILDQPTNLHAGALLAILRDRIDGHVLARGTLRGMYGR